ncbi:MAG: alpha/beta hydrolase [Pseudomonadota bacterium]
MSRFIVIPENPLPPGAEAFTFTASDSAQLRAAYFPTENAVGTVLLVTGWSEFIEKYFEVVGDLQARRLNVAMMDWRGQGLSDDPKRWPYYFDRLTDDLRQFRDGPVAEKFGAAPVYLMTHSMGGLPGLLLMSTGYDGFERAILCAPMTRLFKAAMNSVVGIAASVASLSGLGNTKVARGDDDSRSFDGNMFTSDPARHARFKALQDAEPAAARTAPTYGWLRDATRASNLLHKDDRLQPLRTPVKIISAGLEQRIDADDHKTIAARSALIDHAVIPGALHEIMMERDEIRALYWRAADAFLDIAEAA